MTEAIFIEVHTKEEAAKAAKRRGSVSGMLRILGVPSSTENDVFTDHSLELEERVRGTNLWYDFTEEKKNGIEVEEETYTAPSGLEARIMTFDSEKGQCLTTV